jgi:hypothetical protein
VSQIAERLLDRTGAVSDGCPSGKQGGRVVHLPGRFHPTQMAEVP